VVAGDRVYLTGVRDKKLVTLALDRATGRRLWEAEAPHQKLEQIHAIGSHAQASPATDGERVVSFFGSCGRSATTRPAGSSGTGRWAPLRTTSAPAAPPSSSRTG
jgi:hypothetical protein